MSLETMRARDLMTPKIVKAAPEETLGAKPVWQKLSIVFAGPVMNLLLPILCLMGMTAARLWSCACAHRTTRYGELGPCSRARSRYRLRRS